MESHGECGGGMVLKFVLYYCLPPQMLLRVMDSYRELRRAMGRKVHITSKHNLTRAPRRATESYGDPRVEKGLLDSLRP